MTRKELKQLIKEVILKEDKNTIKNNAIEKIDIIFDDLLDSLAGEDLKISEQSFERMTSTARSYIDKAFDILKKIN